MITYARHRFVPFVVMAPALALCVLGLRAIRADIASARQEAEGRAARIHGELASDLELHLQGVRDRVGRVPAPDLAFRVESTGTITTPPTRALPARARSFAPRDLVLLRDLTQTADVALLRDGDPEAAVASLEPALGLFEDEDLDAILRDRTALVLEKAGRAEDALALHHETLEKHPGARDLEGYPLAIPAALRASALLRSEGREAEADAVDSRLARLLAENPWSLREEQKTFLRSRLPAAPEALLYDAVRGLVLPEVARGGPTAAWTTYRGRAAGRPVLVTLHRGPDGGIEGAVLPVDQIATRLATHAAEVSRVTGATIRLDRAPDLADSAVAGGPLGPPFESLSAHVAVPIDGGGRTLALLWAALSVLLLGGLAVSVGLGVRALRRELRLARLRQEFLDNVSHELRTPLASIRTLAENLRDGAVPEERRTEYFDAMHRESRRVARLVEDVLDLSRLDRGGPRPRAEPVHPLDLAKGAVDDLRAEPGAADFTVRIDTGDDLPTIRGEAEALRRAIGNLLVNAARYSTEIREATIALSESNGIVRIAVRDRGPGIPPEEQEAVFDRFHRIPSATHEVKGTGLGLPLARAIVEAHGGRILLDSAPGRGSTFTIEIPVEIEP